MLLTFSNLDTDDAALEKWVRPTEDVCIDATYMVAVDPGPSCCECFSVTLVLPTSVTLKLSIVTTNRIDDALPLILQKSCHIFMVMLVSHYQSQEASAFLFWLLVHADKPLVFNWRLINMLGGSALTTQLPSAFS